MAYTKTGCKNGRPKQPKNIIRKAIYDRNLEDLLWAYIYEHNYAINNGDEAIFKTNHIVDFLKELIRMKEAKGEDVTDEKELRKFLKAAK